MSTDNSDNSDPGNAPRRRRVLVTGSRDWTSAAVIRDALAQVWGGGDAVVVSGARPAAGHWRRSEGGRTGRAGADQAAVAERDRAARIEQWRRADTDTTTDAAGGGARGEATECGRGDLVGTQGLWADPQEQERT